VSAPPETPPGGRRLLPAALLGGTLLLALLLRGWALGWGLPHAGRFYPYHPDELVLLHAACQVNPLWGDFTPSFYNYGSLYILLSRLAYDLTAPLQGWGTVPRDPPFSAWVGDFAHLLLTGRWVAVSLGVATVALVFVLGRRLFGTRAGLLAAAFLAAAPMAVVLGHYMAVDVPSACWTTLALCLAAGALPEGPARRRVGLVVAAGAAAGLAAGTKYNAGVVLLCTGAPLWFLWREGKRRAALLGAAGAAGAAAAAFVASTPGVVLQPRLFREHLAYELARTAEGQDIVFAGTPPAALYHLGVSLPVGLEWPLFLLALVGVGVSLRRRTPGDALLWLFVVPYFLLLAGAERKFLRYVVPLLPVLVLLAARALDEGLRGPRPRLWAAGGVLAGAAALASSIAHLGVLAAPDSRDRAAAALEAAAAPGDLVAFAADPWYYSPPLHPATGSVKLGELYGGPPPWDPPAERAAEPAPYWTDPYSVLAPRSNQGALSPTLLARYQPRWVIVSDYQTEDPERLRRRNAGYTHPILALQAALGADYELAHIERPRPSFAGFTWWRRGTPPHDWRYFMPEIRLYRRRD